MEENAMSTSSTKKQALSVAAMAEYVAGAVEMETQIYTLEEAIKKHREEKKPFECDNDVKKAQENVDYFKKQYDVLAEKEKTFSYKDYLDFLKFCWQLKSSGEKFATVLGWMFVHYFFGALITAPLTSLLYEANGTASSIVLGLIVGACIWFAIFFKIRSRIRRKRYKNMQATQKKETCSAKENLEHREKVLADAICEYNKRLCVAAKIDEQIASLEQSVEELKGKLNTYYQKNIVPPDYRNFPCVLVIEYVFRNDQADTMREATLICDDHIRHGEVLVVLKGLAETMRGLGNTLNRLSSTIEDIDQDIKRLSSSQEALVSETKASRYAAEALKSSTERLEWAVRYC